ncbi:UNVERIFIED_CONTAM: hypothetical protein FKN15_011579 [Acipenser sinensis]
MLVNTKRTLVSVYWQNASHDIASRRIRMHVNYIFSVREALQRRNNISVPGGYRKVMGTESHGSLDHLLCRLGAQKTTCRDLQIDL